jgi:Holliday junction resolvase RusA-like endonuclease
MKNSRRIIFRGGRPRSIKSAKALSYCDAFMLQAPKLVAPIEGPISVTVTVWYASRRPDLDVALILDLMQKSGIIKNDRQAVEQHLFKRLDPANPRTEIIVQPGDGLWDTVDP